MNQITVQDFKEKIENGEPFRLVDVRDAHELYISNLDIDSLHIPLDDLPAKMDELDKSTPIIVMCRSGNSSSKACELLQSNGYEYVYNLKGGINEWAQKIDPSLPVY